MELTEEVQESLEFWSVLDSSFLMLSLVLNDDLDSVIKKSRWYLVHVSCSVSGQKYLFDEYQVSSERVAWASLRHT